MNPFALPLSRFTMEINRQRVCCLILWKDKAESGSYSLVYKEGRLMSDDGKKDAYSRRGFLGVGTAALAAAGMLPVDAAG